MPDNEDDPALDPNTPMGGAVAAGILRRQADGLYIAYNSPMPDDTPAPPDLDALRARLAAISPTPWVAHAEGIDGGIYDANGYMVCGGELSEGYMDPDEPNTQFIAAAPADIAALLAEVERLRAENDQARAWLAPFMDWGQT